MTKSTSKKTAKAVIVLPPESTLPTSFGGKTYKVARTVTVPTLRHVGGASVAFTVASEMYQGEKIGTDRAAPTIIDIIELETGRKMNYIVPAILRREFIQKYDGDEKGQHAYVGKSFAVHKSEVLEGKGDRQYRRLEVVEIEPA